MSEHLDAAVNDARAADSIDRNHEARSGRQIGALWAALRRLTSAVNHLIAAVEALERARERGDSEVVELTEDEIEREVATSDEYVQPPPPWERRQ